MSTVFLLIVFLPIIGAAIAGIVGTDMLTRLSRENGHERPPAAGAAGHAQEHADTWAGQLTSALLLVSMALSWYAFFDVASTGSTYTVDLFRWIESGNFGSGWVLYVDMLTAVMLVVVTTVSALVHVYSIGYMSHDPHPARFFAYLSLFTFAMLMLVTANNLLQLFFGWEGVGLASYLLIGFWYNRPSANAAAIKAFVVNRVGDFGFILGIVGTFAVFGTIDLGTIFAAVPEQAGETFEFLGLELDVMTTLAILLFIGAMGKSAQFLLHTWLPDAMEGPTPVSALIHAATMVTAGVFLVARMSPFFEVAPAAQTLVIAVGAITAIFAASVGLVQTDIKRVIAYSTCSQLGYMFVAMGVGAYGVGMFHLFTHAFFKALLFLGAGSVIHAMGDEQDMRNMGGLFSRLKITWAVMLIGTLALTGFPLTAGYFSKDAVIEAAFASESPVAQVAFWLVLVAALFTAFYSWRLMFLTFHGRPRASREVMSQAHESPNVMLVPLYVLAAGSLFAGILFYDWFIGAGEADFWGQAIHRAPDNHILEALHHVPAWVVWSPAIMMAAGFAIAWLFYIRRPDLPVALARQNEPLYNFLLNKWYFDEIYDFLLVRPGMWLGRFLWLKGDGWLIDGFGPDGISARVVDVTNQVVRLQTGYLYHYAFAMLIGVAALVTYYMFSGL
ncbi:MAG: NADH-quinone oxidoreductase subunit L [Hyphomicrobiales bacterium]